MTSTTKQVLGCQNAPGAMRGFHSRFLVRRRCFALDVVVIITWDLEFKTRRQASTTEV
jgi:hypothetical protein